MAQSSTGPISNGIRRAIEEAVSGGRKIASIAAEAGIAASQIYRFLDHDPEKHRDLSLAALDKIAGTLGLGLAPIQVVSPIGDAHPASSAVSAKPTETIPIMMASTALNADLSPGHGDNGGLSGGLRPDPKTKGEAGDPPLLPCYMQVRTWRRGPFSPLQQHTIVNIDVFIDLWQGQVEDAVRASGNLGIQDLWAIHSLRHRCVSHDRVQFWEFISNVALKNPTLLGRPDLADRFQDLASLIDDPVSLGQVIALLKSSDLDFSLRSAPHALLAGIESACNLIGLVDAIDPHWNLSPTELQDLAEGKRKRRHIIPGDKDHDASPPLDRPSRYEDKIQLDNGDDFKDVDYDDLEDDEDIEDDSEDDVQDIDDDLEDDEEADCSAASMSMSAQGEKLDDCMPQLTPDPEPTELDQFVAEMQEEMEWRRRHPRPSHKSVVRRGDFNVLQMDLLLQDIENTEILRLAERYRKPGRKVVERAKFISFFTQVLHWNAQGPAILNRCNIYEEYLQVARRLYDHGHMGELANWIEPSDLDLEGEALTERLRHHLERKGIPDGIHGSFLRQKTTPVASAGFAVELPKPSSYAALSSSGIRFYAPSCTSDWKRPKPAP